MQLSLRHARVLGFCVDQRGVVKFYGRIPAGSTLGFWVPWVRKPLLNLNKRGQIEGVPQGDLDYIYIYRTMDHGVSIVCRNNARVEQ